MDGIEKDDSKESEFSQPLAKQYLSNTYSKFQLGVAVKEYISGVEKLRLGK